MKRILILGAGRSSTALIKYLLGNAAEGNWCIRVADRVHKAIPDTKGMSLISADITDIRIRESEIKNADLVISLLPASLHPLVAQTCVKYSKNLITASYETNELKKLEKEVVSKQLIFLNECGLDPGIDHMSAMCIIDRLKNNGYEILSFESFTGGLVAQESEENPWHYKFSWNPRNVVLAGQPGPAMFIQNGKYKYIPYNRLFRRTELIEIEGNGWFEGYANRDSLKYIEKYHLQGIPTIYRGTLRRPGFCRAWNVFVQLGATDDSYVMRNTEEMTYREFINSFLYYHPTDSVELKLYHYMHIDQDSDIIQKLQWLGIFDNTPIGLHEATPAQILEHILKQKWQLISGEKDLVVMWHKFVCRSPDTRKEHILTSSLVVTGENDEQTAMAKTVGLPLAIAARMVLSGKIERHGIIIPVTKEIYAPVLAELSRHGVIFSEHWTGPPLSTDQ